MSFYCCDEDFALWAFGNTWHAFMVMDADCIDLMQAWNVRHGDIFIVDWEGDTFTRLKMPKDLHLMKQAWSDEVGAYDKPKNRKRASDAQKKSSNDHPIEEKTFL